MIKVEKIKSIHSVCDTAIERNKFKKRMTMMGYKVLDEKIDGYEKDGVFIVDKYHIELAQVIKYDLDCEGREISSLRHSY